MSNLLKYRFGSKQRQAENQKLQSSLAIEQSGARSPERISDS
jgi:hypothetical protein